MKTRLLFATALSLLMLTACKKDAEMPKTDGTNTENKAKASAKGESAKPKGLKLEEVLIGEWTVKDKESDREETFAFFKDGTFEEKYSNGKSGKGRWQLLGSDRFALMSGDATPEESDRFKVVYLSRDTFNVHHENEPDEVFVCTRRK